MGKLQDYAINRTKQYSKVLSQNGRMRTDMGLIHAAGMISTAAHNLEILTGGVDPINISVKRFSQQRDRQNVRRFSADGDMPAFSNVGNNGLASVQAMQTVSAIDVTIQMLIYSFLPWIAIERPMTDSTTTISWREIVATNTAGGVQKGERLIGNFIVENSGMNLQTPVKTLEATGEDKQLALDFGCQLYEGTILAVLTLPDGSTVTGKDYNSVIAFPGDTTAFNVDYVNGVVTSASTIKADYKVSVQAMADMWASKTNPSVLRGTTNMRSVQMVSKESGIIMEDSTDRMMFILKTLDQAGGAMSLEEYMNKMMFDLYVAFVNNLLMIGIHTRSQQLEGTAELEDLTKDLSVYGSQIIADPARKYDELAALTEAMSAYMLRTVNCGVTCWIVGGAICQIMAADTFRFKKSDTYNTQNNTLAGVYDGKPVLRHEYIDKYIDSTDGFGNIFGVHRDPNGEVAFMAYGEYLPIHTTDNVYNFNNPLQFAKALVSQIGTKIIEPGLCVRGKFRVTAR